MIRHLGTPASLFQMVLVATLLLFSAAHAASSKKAALGDPAELDKETNVAEAKRMEAALKKRLKALESRRKQVEQGARKAAPAGARGATADAGARGATADAGAQSRIVNGLPTFDYHATGALIAGASAADATSWCTGTLIGCRTFLTANHCVHDDRRPGQYHVYFQVGGIYDVDSISPERPNYRFPEADLAVLKLKTPVEGVAPVAINTAAVEYGTIGTIVGFGRSGGTRKDYGIKRAGTVVTAKCDRPEKTLLCWDFNSPGDPGTGSNTCNADSGGPLFVDDGSGSLLLAGVTSGGTKANCLEGDHSYDVDVRQYAAWIAEMAGADLGSGACGPFIPVGAAGTDVAGQRDRLEANGAAEFEVNVPAGRRLRIGLNGQDELGTNVDLSVKRAAAPGADPPDCIAEGTGNYAFCEIAAPTPGRWFIEVRQGPTRAGDFQLAVTILGRKP